ncbi:site-specific integrase [Primorskyibacter sedentarius]|uniref:site-specific integrase n=1 Tax=Primorskyibacter sedentarius TaxID=745311 RepID=UPI003EBFCBFF
MAYTRRLPSGRWQVSIRRKGVRPISKTFRTKAAAEAWARERENEIDNVGAVTDSDSTIADLLDRYEREVTAKKKGRVQEESRLAILKASLGTYRATALTAGDVAHFVSDRLKACTSDTVRRDVAVLSAALETALVLRWLPLKSNAAREAIATLTRSRSLKVPNRRVRRIATDELVRLMVELVPPMCTLVCFALETAMRRGELAKMRWEHIKGHSLLIPDDKTGKSANIPLSSAAVKLLEGLPGEHDTGPVFGLQPDSITQAFDRACARAGIQDLRVHDLRHEATSRLFERGLTIEEVATITRHSDWRSLKIYTHPSHAHIRSKLG